MSSWKEVGRLSDLAADAPIAARIGGKAVGVYLIDGEVVAVGNICPHQADVILSDGWIEDGTIECPMHQSRFDLRTGRCLSPPAFEDLPVYPVNVTDGIILIDVG